MKNGILSAALPLFGFLPLFLIRITRRLRSVGEKKIEDYYEKNRTMFRLFRLGSELPRTYFYQERKIKVLIGQHTRREIIRRSIRRLGLSSASNGSSKEKLKSLIVEQGLIPRILFNGDPYLELTFWLKWSRVRKKGN